MSNALFGISKEIWFSDKRITLNILRSVGNYVYNNLKSNKVLVNPPQGAFYLMPEFPNKRYKTSTKLCEAILEETGVAMLPASDFGFRSDKMLTRLCYIDFDGSEFFNSRLAKEDMGWLLNHLPVFFNPSLSST